MQKILKFDIGLIENYYADEDADFALLHLEFLSDGYNSHGIPITTEILKRDASTILGKPIVAKYDQYTQDVQGHETDEIMVGYVPNNANITFKDTENGLFACVDGLISKLYSNDVYKLYQTHNHRAVSVEMTIDWEESDESETVSGIHIRGVTLLGLTYQPSCTLASSKIVQFSLEEVNNFYETKLQDQLINFAERRKRKMTSTNYKINDKELKTTPWGQIDKIELRNKIMSATNRASLVHKVYGIVENGWEQAPSEKLQYPLMELINDTLYYNRYALSSALAYARQNNEEKVINKIQKLYKHFGLKEDNTEGEDNKMKNTKFEIEGREAWGDVIKQVQSHEGKDAYVDSIEKDHIIYTIKNVRYRVEADVEVGKDDKSVKATIKWDTKKKDVDQKMSDYSFKDCKSLEEKLEKIDKMSADENVDASAIAEMLKQEAQTNKQLAEQLEEKEHIIMEYEAELTELREFKSQCMSEKKTLEVDSTMSEIKEFIDDNKFKELKEEGMNCDFEILEGWKNKVRALAFENTKQKITHSGRLWSMGFGNPEPQSNKGLWD